MQEKVKRLADTLNLAVSLFWSLPAFFPIAIFCYSHLESELLYLFAAISFVIIFLPTSFFNKLQLSANRSIYKKIGIKFFSRFTQNGDIVNGIVKKKYPGYKVVSSNHGSMKKLLGQTHMFEKFHYMVFVFFMLTAVYALLRCYCIWAIALTVTNMVFNVYPIFLQQYTRLRLRSLNSAIK